MRRVLLCCLALSLAGIAPSAAEKVFVPVVEPIAADGRALATEMWISNYDLVERSYSAKFLRAESNGTERAGSARSLVPADRAVLLDRLAPAGETGLVEIEIDAIPELLVDAWVRSTGPGGAEHYAALPVITRHNQAAAGTTARLLRLERDSYATFDLAVANFGAAPASCRAEFFGNDGSPAGETTLIVEAQSLGRAKDIHNLTGGARFAHVSCDQAFYAFASIVDRATGIAEFVTPGAPEENELASAADAADEPLVFSFRRTGVFHTAKTGQEKGIIRIPVPNELNLAKLTVTWDVIPGPWHSKTPHGNHAMIWLHRGKFRSNTMANVNAFGPKKSFVKMNQNVDMAAKTNTNAKVGMALDKGIAYRVVYTYDAANRDVTTKIYNEKLELLKTMQMKGTAQNRTLKIPVSGMIAEFGHYKGQHFPELPSYGWSYANIIVEGVPNK